MDIIEEEKSYGHIGKTRHITISRRDTLINDFKNSTVQGLVSLLLSLGALFMVFFGIYRSYRMEGAGGYELGILMILALLFAVLSLLFGVLGLRNRKKIRHYMEKRGIVISIIVILGLIALFITGLGAFEALKG
ncbi:MAG: hypothetical protein IJL78_08015 [Lachnospiraceae bacterium]|nr:hypothetical protein [Lachnospiraceae bacterium]